MCDSQFVVLRRLGLSYTLVLQYKTIVNIVQEGMDEEHK